MFKQKKKKSFKEVVTASLVSQRRDRQNMAEPNHKLHVAVFPWLALGHMIPYLQLSKLIATKGHTVSFISTPRNIARLPKTPSINFVSLPLPHAVDNNLPENAESTTDVPETHIAYLKKAFDGLSEPFSQFLQASKPDWIVYDILHYWVPPIAEKLGVRRALFCTFNAASIIVIDGPSSIMINGRDPRKTLNDSYRTGLASAGSEVIAIRTCTELEPEWIQLLGEIQGKPVIPIGLLPAKATDDDVDDDIREWLDRQRAKSVVYVALGTEVTVSEKEIQGLAHGLELSGLPFFWTIRKASVFLPDGFEERVKGRGVVRAEWAPQGRILSHGSVGGFVTHCGWGSVVEGLSFGVPLIMFPCNLDQPLVARMLAGMNIGREIPRNELDGSFTSVSVVETIRLVVVEEEGKIYRDNAESMQKNVFGNRRLQDQYVDSFIKFLENHRA
ncbi:BnaA09g52430D [Brassica napus]|uniref:Glycosyltransferase n=1 Tax=Brassica napus TaxID=3708 RepID=A0A078IU15_BRANA|nr:BnaA09g52430D [Brassica napus]